MAILMKTQKIVKSILITIKMSSGNRKTFDDDKSASPSSLQEASKEETPNLRNQKSASNVKPLDQKLITSENQDEDICAICMGSYENMCHPNECFHKYCFGCLEQGGR